MIELPMNVMSSPSIPSALVFVSVDVVIRDSASFYRERKAENATTLRYVYPVLHGIQQCGRQKCANQAAAEQYLTRKADSLLRYPYIGLNQGTEVVVECPRLLHFTADSARTNRLVAMLQRLHIDRLLEEKKPGSS